MADPSSAPDTTSYGIDSDDDEDTTPLAAQPPAEEAERQAQIINSYKEYLNEIRDELPPPSTSGQDLEEGEGGGGPIDPDEETIGDGTLDPPEEVTPLTTRRGPFRRFREARQRRRDARSNSNRAYHDPDDELDEMYQELGVAPPSRSVAYTHPFLHALTNKKIMVIATLVIVTIVGLAIGLSKDKPEILKVLSQEEDKLHELLHSSYPEGDGSEVLTEAQRESEEYQYVTEFYMPDWHGRGDGWVGQSYDEAILYCAGLGRILCPYEAYCPLGKSTIPLGGGQNVPQSWAPVIDHENGWVQIGQTNQCNQWDDLYTKPPAWGETGAGSEIITEHIMCCAPHKIDSQQRPGATSSGATTADTQVSSGGSSGATAADTQVQSGSASTEPESTTDSNWEQTVYQNIPGAQYAVGWFNRDNGWDGTDMNEALKFCAKQKTILCPFAAICPNGADGEPVGGAKIAPEGGIAWAPVLEIGQTNEWVALSQPDVCIKYTNMHASSPAWGAHGGNEAETRNVACCKATGIATASDAKPSPVSNPTPVVIGTPQPTPEPTKEPTDPPTEVQTTSSQEDAAAPPTTPVVTEPAPNVYTPTTPSPTTANEGKSMEMLYAAISSIHKPVWFDRSSGWSGSSWGEAQDFCSSQFGDDGTVMRVCDLGAYCPLPGHQPIQGAREMPDDDRGAWSPFGNMQNGWVRVDSTQSCTVYNTMYGSAPGWGYTGAGANAITQNIMCCKTTHVASASEPTPLNSEVSVSDNTDATISFDSGASTPATSPAATTPASVNTEKPTNDKLVQSTFDTNAAKYIPNWFDRSAWKGTSYSDGIEFCAGRGWVLCPYEAYCPLGPGAHLYGGVRNADSMWAPLIDIPNGWVQVGSVDTCELYNALHPHPPLWGLNGEGDAEVTEHIMCCDSGFTTIAEASQLASQTSLYDTPTVKEQDVLYNFNPVWFQRKHGYGGTTHEEALDFCKHISNDMELCPLAAYCPNGESGNLFYGRAAFEGEQWAPILDGDSPDWVQIGTVDEVAMCTTYSGRFGNTAPWESDGGSQEKKQHILCCETEMTITDPETNESTTMAEVMAETLRPIWYGETHGWNGGSHNDAQLFCSASGGKDLCPYVAICPNGKGNAPMGGHKVDFNAAGEQWVPVGGLDNHWVMIGQMYDNMATTCMSYEELVGAEGPQWGITTDNEPGKKKFILCCDNNSQ